MNNIARTIGLASAVAILTTAAAIGGEITLSSGVGGVFGVPVTSMKERRSVTVVQQQFDFSCGAAAVATLLTYHYGLYTEEEEVFTSMFHAGDQQKIQINGFSMLDMKSYLDAQGFHTDGFRLTMDKMEEIGVPMITLIDFNGYRHFVVVKGIEDDRVLIRDPAFGIGVLDIERFQAMWTGTALAIRDNPSAAQQYFNIEEEWMVEPLSPIGRGDERDRGLSSFTLHLPQQRVF